MTLSDLAADVRALTPSEAAERIAPDQREISDAVRSLGKRMKLAISSNFAHAEQQLEMLATKSALTRPLDRIRMVSQELDHSGARMVRSMDQRLSESEHQIKEMAARLESINPLSVLARGYSLTSDSEGKLLTDTKTIDVGDNIKTRLANGTIVSEVQSKTE